MGCNTSISREESVQVLNKYVGKFFDKGYFLVVLSSLVSPLKDISHLKHITSYVLKNTLYLWNSLYKLFELSKNYFSQIVAVSI
jgi:hypothetical protein